jgi:hypothetical protein
MEPQPTDEGI